MFYEKQEQSKRRADCTKLMHNIEHNTKVADNAVNFLETISIPHFKIFNIA